MITIDAAGLSNIGDTMPINEDRIWHKTCKSDDFSCGLFLVADGIGGRNGNLASQTVVDVLSTWWENSMTMIVSSEYKMERLLASLDGAIANANTNVIALQTNKLVGTTLSLLFIKKQHYFIRHVGNSRIYSLGQNFLQLTPDNTYAANLARAGKITEAEIATHPKRNVLTRCIGVKCELYKHEEQYTPGAQFLLCTKGFYNAISGNTVCAISQNPRISSAGKVHLMRENIKPGTAAGNLSAIVVATKQVS